MQEGIYKCCPVIVDDTISDARAEVVAEAAERLNKSVCCIGIRKRVKYGREDRAYYRAACLTDIREQFLDSVKDDRQYLSDTLCNFRRVIDDTL